ncbi:MAG TPA: LytTR family DNA-binding domain-containing protein [Actinomycetales bacterium]|nr:LytTR family DNA-binding domain-containing protein [Actinomycetales bacterium]
MVAPVALRALVVDDEPPARDELVYLLGLDSRIGSVQSAGSAAEALRRLESEPFDVVFSDVRMPGLTGVDLARILARFTQRPAVVFITAYDDTAVDAFELQAVDYVMKPVRPERLAEAVRRVVSPTAMPEREENDDETILVELGGVTRFVQRSQVRWVEAQGDYARLHTADGSHLVRAPLSSLEQRWTTAGFVRIHRSTLVALRYVDELRVESGRWSLRVDGTDLPVSRRHSRAVRDRLAGQGRPVGQIDPSGEGGAR